MDISPEASALNSKVYSALCAANGLYAYADRDIAFEDLPDKVKTITLPEFVQELQTAIKDN